MARGGNRNTNNTQSKQEVKYADPRMAYSSTKKEMVIKETDLTANDIFNNEDYSKAIIAEDQNGFYVTVKSVVGASILDGYRMYKRNLAKVDKIDDNNFTITSDFATFTV